MEHISSYMNGMPEKQNQKLIAAFLIGALVGVVGSWIVVSTMNALAERKQDNNNSYLQGSEEEVNTDNQTVVGANIPGPSDIQVRNELISVSDQPAGATVAINKAVFEEAGWVVIHEGTASHIGNALGAARFDAGEHGGTVKLLRATEAGKTYRAVLYRDNGDRTFSLDTDFPFLGNGNQPIIATFVAQ